MKSLRDRGRNLKYIQVFSLSSNSQAKVTRVNKSLKHVNTTFLDNEKRSV